jgi:hypothetical protein
MNQVLIETLKQDLRRLRLKDMAETLDSALERAEKQREGYLTFLSQLVSTQLKARHSRSVERRIKKAGLNKNMTFETYDWNFQPSLNVEYLKDLAGLSSRTRYGTGLSPSAILCSSWVKVAQERLTWLMPSEFVPARMDITLLVTNYKPC